MWIYYFNSLLILPYCFIVCMLWATAIAMAIGEDGDAVGFSFAFGIVWTLVTTLFTLMKDNSISDEFVFCLQFLPLILLCLFGIYLFLNNLHKKNLLHYIVYTIPVLLTLTLFFL